MYICLWLNKAYMIMCTFQKLKSSGFSNKGIVKKTTVVIPISQLEQQPF